MFGGRAEGEGEMTIPRPQEWTEAEVHQLRMLAKRKVSADSIAKSLGRAGRRNHMTYRAGPPFRHF